MKTLGLLMLGAAFVGACGETKDEPSRQLQGEAAICNERACMNHLAVTIRPLAGTFKSGIHQLSVTLPSSEALQCSLTYEGGEVSAPCPPGLSWKIVPQLTCTTGIADGGLSESCAPIPGKFEAKVVLLGNPANLRMVQKTTTEQVFDRLLAPSYTDTTNGAGCSVCTAGAEVMVLDPEDSVAK